MSMQRLLIPFVLSILPFVAHANPQFSDGDKLPPTLQSTLSNAVSQAVIEMANLARGRKASYHLTDRSCWHLMLMRSDEENDRICDGIIKTSTGILAEIHNPAHQDVLGRGRELRVHDEIWLTSDTNKVQVSFFWAQTISETYTFLLTNSPSGWHLKQHQTFGCSSPYGFIDEEIGRKK